jgi:hypothetical protein
VGAVPFVCLAIIAATYKDLVEELLHILDDVSGALYRFPASKIILTFRS